MTEAVSERISGLNDAARACFCALYGIVRSAAGARGEERLWAGMPSVYVGGRFVRVIPFADHVNVEASAAAAHRASLPGYRFTPKGMLQIGCAQAVPEEALRRIAEDTFFPNDHAQREA